MQNCIVFEWDDARHFLALYRAGSLSAAARELKVNQSTVGRRIAALEEVLGVRLFAKTPEGYVVTPDGERLVPRAERMEEETLAVIREVADESSLSGLVRITSTDAFGARMLTRILVELHARYPDIQLEIIADNRLLSLARREADLSLRFARPSDPFVVARKLMDFGQALYASKEYIARRGCPRSPDFKGHSFIDLRGPGTQLEAEWLEPRAKQGRIVFTTGSTVAQLEATLGGMGLAVLPCYLADPEPTLVRVLGPDEVVQRTLWLVIHRDLQRSARVRACADFIAEGLAKREALVRGTWPKGNARAGKKKEKRASRAETRR
jgi:DNA-binding transcriptional LysR family regulator